MAGINGLNEKTLSKTVIVFDLEDVLAPGSILKSVSSSKVKSVLLNLRKLSQKFSFFHFLVVSGFQKELAFEKIRKFGLTDFFSEKQILFVSQEYMDFKEEMDREIYFAELKKNPDFKDEFFKQKALEKLAADLNVSPEKIVFVGHDLFFDAFYSDRFSKIDFVLVKEALANQNEKQKSPVKGLNYIALDWKDIRNVLLGKLPKTDSQQLKNFIGFYLQQKLVDPSVFSKILEAKLKKMQGKLN